MGFYFPQTFAGPRKSPVGTKLPSGSPPVDFPTGPLPKGTRSGGGPIQAMSADPGGISQGTPYESGSGYQTTDASGSDPWATPPSSNISQEQWDAWRASNPGDESRWQSAFGSGSGTANQNQSPTQQWNSSPLSNQSQQFYDLLMGRINQPWMVDRNNPYVRNQVDPAVAQMERASRNYIDQLAEQGGPLANLQGERRLASERQGQAAGQLEAEVLNRIGQALLGERQQALGLYGGQLQADNSNALQWAMGQANRSQALDMFLRELAQRQYEYDNSWSPF